MQHARGQRRRQTFASPSMVRWSSAVDSTIELACTGLTHKARAALFGLSGRRHGHGRMTAGAAFGFARRTLERPMLGSVRSFRPIRNPNVRYTLTTSHLVSVSLHAPGKVRTYVSLSPRASRPARHRDTSRTDSVTVQLYYTLCGLRVCGAPRL